MSDIEQRDVPAVLREQNLLLRQIALKMAELFTEVVELLPADIRDQDHIQRAMGSLQSILENLNRVQDPPP
jgi:hypothetical protein